MQEITWGLVTAISPSVLVRFVGDTGDTKIGWKSSGLTLATNDKVLLAKSGSRDGWVIVLKLATT
jgi:hypothetical protein